MMKAMRKLAGGGAPANERERSAIGAAASMAGVALNALLFALKMGVGLVSGSVAVMADAFNNLSDASSSIVSLIGFHLAQKPADEAHPYGHGRFEYLSALVVAVMVMVIGVELLQGSVRKILAPEPVEAGLAAVLVLAASIGVKLALARFYRRVGRQIDSASLAAAAQDSRNDVLATGAVLLSLAVSRATGVTLDGYMGAAVALFILVSGFSLVRSTLDPLLGVMPTRERLDAICDRILSYPDVLGVHDLMVHDYGPGRQFASVHAEMPASLDIMVCHDLLDGIEREFLEREGLHLVIHLDPVATDDPRLPVLRAHVARIAAQIHPQMSVHDLRIVGGESGERLCFDCLVPYDLTMPIAELRGRLCSGVAAHDPQYRCVITFERGAGGA